jgi:putative oxidoreductase
VLFIETIYLIVCCLSQFKYLIKFTHCKTNLHHRLAAGGSPQLKGHIMKSNTTDYAALLLRLALGAMFLTHGLLKFLVFTLPGTAGFFESVGFPGWTAYIVTPVEILAGVALVAGFQTRWVALAGIPILLGSLVVHAGNGWVFSNPKGGWEYPVYLVITAAVVALLGGGRIAFTQPAQQR